MKTPEDIGPVKYSIAGETIDLMVKARAEHASCHDYFSVHYSHSSGIGTAIVMKCLKCGTEFNVTDYGNW